MKILGKAKQGTNNNGYLFGEEDGSRADGERRCKGNFLPYALFFFKIKIKFVYLHFFQNRKTVSQKNSMLVRNTLFERVFVS